MVNLDHRNISMSTISLHVHSAIASVIPFRVLLTVRQQTLKNTLRFDSVFKSDLFERKISAHDFINSSI